jgi:toxin ParE1/3/4
MNVHISKRAQRDLDQIWDYIAQHNVDAANKVLDQIYDLMKLLGRFPRMGHTRADVGSSNLRFIAAYSYLIVHRLRGRKVTVIRVIHGAMNLKALFPRK